jgi:hypothetical protein
MKIVWSKETIDNKTEFSSLNKTNLTEDDIKRVLEFTINSLNNVDTTATINYNVYKNANFRTIRFWSSKESIKKGVVEVTVKIYREKMKIMDTKIGTNYDKDRNVMQKWTTLNGVITIDRETEEDRTKKKKLDKFADFLEL